MPRRRWGAYPKNDDYSYRVEKTRGSYKLFRRGPRSNSRDNANLGTYGFLKEAKVAAEADWVKRSAFVPPPASSLSPPAAESVTQPA
jgi:hypothetical protein